MVAGFVAFLAAKQLYAAGIVGADVEISLDENGGPAYGEEDQDANSGYEQDGSDGEETEE